MTHQKIKIKNKTQNFSRFSGKNKLETADHNWLLRTSANHPHLVATLCLSFNRGKILSKKLMTAHHDTHGPAKSYPDTVDAITTWDVQKNLVNNGE